MLGPVFVTADEASTKKVSAVPKLIGPALNVGTSDEKINKLTKLQRFHRVS